MRHGCQRRSGEVRPGRIFLMRTIRKMKKIEDADWNIREMELEPEMIMLDGRLLALSRAQDGYYLVDLGTQAYASTARGRICRIDTEDGVRLRLGRNREGADGIFSYGADSGSEGFIELGRDGLLNGLN